MTDGEVLIRASDLMERASHDHAQRVAVRVALRVAAEWCRRKAVVTA